MNSKIYSMGKLVSTPLPTPDLSETKKRKRASKTRRPGLKEAIRAAYKTGNTTINEIMEEILTQGFQLSKSSVNTIMRDLSIGKRYSLRKNAAAPVSKTCNRKNTCKDKK